LQPAPSRQAAENILNLPEAADRVALAAVGVPRFAIAGERVAAAAPVGAGAVCE